MEAINGIGEAAFQRRGRATQATAPVTVPKLQISTQEEDLETRRDFEGKGEEETTEIVIFIATVTVAITVPIAVVVDVVNAVKQPGLDAGQFVFVTAVADLRDACR